MNISSKPGVIDVEMPAKPETVWGAIQEGGAK